MWPRDQAALNLADSPQPRFRRRAREIQEYGTRKSRTPLDLGEPRLDLLIGNVKRNRPLERTNKWAGIRRRRNGEMGAISGRRARSC